MRPRAFIVMPFGVKEYQYHDSAGSVKAVKIDFTRVCKELLEPALYQAGCDAKRSDEIIEAGDIRRDMFADLLTANFVVADLTVPDPNVFYELGVREGACPRGVITVRGNGGGQTPFDVAPDRMFAYDPSFFFEEGANTSAEDKDGQLRRLTQVFERAIAADPGTIGSPVYSLLPGLKPVNLEGIDTPQMQYVERLASGWRRRVAEAQRAGRPGDILTLAANPPTRVRNSKFLYEAALALLGLCRYEAARDVFEQFVLTGSSDLEAQLQYATVLIRLRKIAEARDLLNDAIVRADSMAAAEADDLLGQANRYLWHLAWHTKPGPERRKVASDKAFYASDALELFLKAHQSDPTLYFAGFNALMLGFVLKQLGVPNKLDDEPTRQELETVVRYTANNVLARAAATKNYNDEFWCMTTLAGIDFINERCDPALATIESACSLDAPTTFQLRSFQARLELVQELQFGSENQQRFIEKALDRVNRALQQRLQTCGCRRVFVSSGGMFKPGDSTRVPAPEHLDALVAKLDALLEVEGVGEADLAICTGMTEGDILFAESCLKRSMRVRLLKRAAVGRESDARSWPFSSNEWQRRWRALTEPHPGKEIWEDDDHLGPVVALVDGENDLEAVARQRHVEWLHNTARTEAEPATETDEGGSERLCVVVFDDQESDDAADSARWVDRVQQKAGLRVKAISLNMLAGS